MLKQISLNDFEFGIYSKEGQNLEKIFWEKNSYEQLLAFMINKNMKNSEDYMSLWADYLNTIKLWNSEIRLFEQNVVKTIFANQEVHSWEYTFEDGILNVNL